MALFDSIASPTVRTADNLEPSFVHADQIDVAKRKLTDHQARRKKRPNILIFMMDDVGWGDFGCYGGGVAVGAPTRNFDKLARSGLQLTSCYSEPSCSPSWPSWTVRTAKPWWRGSSRAAIARRLRATCLALPSSAGGKCMPVRVSA